MKRPFAVYTKRLIILINSDDRLDSLEWVKYRGQNIGFWINNAEGHCRYEPSRDS